MGVPSFFLWLAKKCPRILINVIRPEPIVINGQEVPLDTSSPNPNGIEFDNLYLDMNGIIHPCVHPEGLPAPDTVEEMIAAIFDYIDFVFCMVRPRKLLFMAIDGVAPRAKMNQQRSRRFKSIKEGERAEKEGELLQAAIDAELKKRGLQPQPKKEKKERFDHNCITPGTVFMDRVARALRWYASEKCSNDPGWANLAVVLSDATVPGEGEHKIMDFIRSQRQQASYDPNTTHCVYGLDADLIMLGLSTHEVNFYILREVVFFSSRSQCTRCGREGHQKDNCEGAGFHLTERGRSHVETKPFQFLSISVLKEYLAHQLSPNVKPAFELIPERLCDDFVFLCFLVGNDFLPHLPTLEIREGAIDLLIGLYRKILPTLGGYMTCQGELNMERAHALMKEVGPLEDPILQNRIVHHERQKSNRARRNQNKKRARLSNDAVPTASSVEQELRDARVQASYDMDVQDELRMGREGWRDRYYETKLNCKNDSPELAEVACHFVDGMIWVLRYYYQGCSDWNWYYPYHYSPTARDLARYVPWSTYDLLEGHQLANHGETEPFKPIQQLMAVLPSQSQWCLPPVYGNLMETATSPLIEYYPKEFFLDMEGKRFMWQSVAILPFIDGPKLLSVLEPLEKHLTPAETQRNMTGTAFLFLGKNWPGNVRLAQGSPCYSPAQEGNLFFAFEDAKFEIPEDPQLPGIRPFRNNQCRALEIEFPPVTLEDLRPTLLPGAVRAPPVLSPEELENRGPSHGAAAKLLPYQPRQYGGRGGGQQQHQRNRPDIRQSVALPLGQGAPALLPTPFYQEPHREERRDRFDDGGGHDRRSDSGGYDSRRGDSKGYDRRNDSGGYDRRSDSRSYDRRDDQRRSQQGSGYDRKRTREDHPYYQQSQYQQPQQAPPQQHYQLPSQVTPQLSMIALLQQYQQAQKAKQTLAEMRRK